MSRLFYPRLAASNIKKNGQTYIPYVLTCIATVMMFYNMCFLAVVKDIGNLSDSQSLRLILRFGAGVIGIFSAIFLFYTNSFLIKRRKKEFGLFNILGMEKKHIARIMFFETLFIAAISLAAGILAGILLSKLMVLLLFKIISFKVSFGFEIPLPAVFTVIALFSGIFLLNLLYNVCQVHLSKPVELLKGGNVGEKEPKTKWLMAIIGAICLGIGYYIALTTESPLAALNLFFVAVVMVMAGTYCLFTAGSIAILKMLRKNKGYYYKIQHFISVSGMIYRMKQNAAGLANICILSTAVIVMLSSTISLYVGIEEVLRNRYPRNVMVNAYNVSDELAAKLDAVINEQAEKAGVDRKDPVRYRYMSFAVNQDGTSFTAADPASYSSGNIAMVNFFTQDEYNKMENKSVSLSEGEALLFILKGDISGDTVSFGDLSFTVKERLDSFGIESQTAAVMSKSYFVVVDNLTTIKQVYKSLGGKNEKMEELSYFYGFDVDAGGDVQIRLVRSLQNALSNLGVEVYADGPEISRESFYSVYGGLFFLGLFLGLLFIMATVLIIYYKQIVEGFNDKERFEIMQKVGMGHHEIKKSIQSQVLTVFFLPLVTAVIHIAFAFKVITKLLLIFNLTNVPLFAMCTAATILVFAVFYAAVYAMTARAYYRIVK